MPVTAPSGEDSLRTEGTGGTAPPATRPRLRRIFCLSCKLPEASVAAAGRAAQLASAPRKWGVQIRRGACGGRSAALCCRRRKCAASTVNDQEPTPQGVSKNAGSSGLSPMYGTRYKLWPGVREPAENLKKYLTPGTSGAEGNARQSLNYYAFYPLD